MASGARNTETNRRLAPTIGEKNETGGGGRGKEKKRKEEKRKERRKKSAGDKYLKRYTRRGDNADYMQRLEN